MPEFVRRPLRPYRSRFRNARYVQESLISQGFAAHVDIAGRFEKMRQIFPGAWTPDYATERCNAILPNMTAGRERYGRLAAGAATEARDPFLDKRVVDYCSRLPGHVRIRGGWPKIILREIMEDRLPNEVRWAREKPHLGWLFNKFVTSQAIAKGELEIERLKKDLEAYVDSDALDRAWLKQTQEGDFEAIHSAYMLSRWLRESVSRPVVQI